MDEMQPKPDAELLRDYAERGSESAFAEIVTRYTNLVYSAALRQTDSPDLARDVGQSVFTDLARKAERISKTLAENASLAGWLYRGTRFAALTLRRGEQRRKIRERQAMEQINPTAPETSPDWGQIRPLLDEAMDELEENDREALLLRFFKNEDLRVVGAALGITDDAAQKRVSRAVERLREIFAKRGVAIGGGGLTAAVCANAVQAAPAGLAAVFTGAAVAGVSATGATLSAWKIMALTKFKLGVAAAIVVAGVTTSVIVQQQAQARMRAQDELWRRQSEQIAKLKAESEQLGASAVGTGGNNLEALAKVRAEVAGLRARTNALARLPAGRSQTSSGTKTPLEAIEDSQAMAIAKMNLTRQWNLAAIMYAGDNKGQFPTNFDAAAAYFSKKGLDTNVNLDQFEIVFQGSLESLTNPSQTIIIREIDAMQTSGGNWAKAYGFADGHSEIHGEPQNDFNTFETKHGVSQ
jgi:RNA polymerase sigma factor (sigma-70 family)